MISHLRSFHIEEIHGVSPENSIGGGHYLSVPTDHPNISQRSLRLPVEPCELPDGIQLVYVDERDRQHVIALEEAAGVDFCQMRAFRRSPAYRGQRNFPGWWWSVTTRSHVPYESWLERHYIIEADRDAMVTGIAGKPFGLTWPEGKRQMQHVPDLFCRTLDGRGTITECRSAGKGDEKFSRKAAIAAAACDVIGWRFRAVNDPDPVWAANLRWLAGYRHPRFGDEHLEALLLEIFASPLPLAEAGRQAGDPIRVLPVVFHLMWRTRLHGDLSRPLGPGAILTSCADPLDSE